MIGSKRYWRIRHRSALALMAGLLPHHAEKYIDQIVDHVIAWPEKGSN